MSHSHSQLRDPAIKLFGRNIPLPDPDIPAIHLQSMDERIEATKSQDGDAVEKPCEQDSFSESDNGQENEAEASRVAEEDVGAESDKCGKEKALKKPDRLIPCPRCNSLETKFCYFNNYNVNQPRHFCKNCHRYWTAGGTIRNVPVGTGRRRNAKHSSSQPRQAPKSPNTAVAALGENCRNGVLPSSDSPLCDSMESKLNLKDPKRADAGSAVDGDCCESSSSSAAATSGDNEDSPAENVDPSQSFPVPQWAYPWSPSFNVVMVGPNNSYYPSPVMTVPGCCSPSVPFSFVPGSYWGYVPSCEAGKWISPVLGPVGSVSPSCSTSNNGCLSNVSPALGKHSRDVSSKTDESTEKCLWVPKTLRIDNPNEAAKSSIWSTLGIEPDRNQGFKRSGIFKPFNKRKSDANPRKTDSDQVLQSNPAALSRSHSFQEST